LLLAAALLPGCATGPRRPHTAPDATAQVEATPPTSAPRWRPIGLSVARRLLLVTESGSGPLRVYVIGGVHGNEIEGRTALEAFRNEPIAAATIRILRDLNPDGTAANQRVNARGYDLNRNWPAANYEPGLAGGDAPLSEPETRALQQDLSAFRPDLVVVLHSTAIGPLVNYDGPAEPQATAFAAAAQAVQPGWRVTADMGYPTPGSLGNYLGVDQHIPILTIEFERGQDEVAAAAALRRGLAAAILASRQTEISVKP
jgi:protein MpaA